ncbi:hypothetical protein [Alteribacter keqinensis]|uniref:Uncharacterized protein n=1 Tax=Alteribacter keqinensis TaxID=2483800 RepID=A0A3M7TR87_9BACI|nr:hypothetical protein [Alteribacter keqinensis]RNA67941.1 hypothetical protein EBO34_14700 [Alteribacter keqinensis]
MAKKGTSGIERGQAITFRLPSDTPDHLIKQLQDLKETEKRNFSSKIAQFALEGVSQSLQKERETITIPLPKGLSKEQRNWIRHAHSEALLGNIVYQLLADPIRASSVLASLNSSSLDIDEALYLQEGPSQRFEHSYSQMPAEESSNQSEEHSNRMNKSEFDDQLDNFDWGQAQAEQASSSETEKEPEEEDADDLLGGFLDRMNR